MDADGRARIPRERLAAEAGAAPEAVERILDAGLVRRGPDGTFAPGDVRRVEAFLALEAAGLTLDQLATVVGSGLLDLAYLDDFFTPPSPLTGRTFADFRAALGPLGARLGPVHAMLGIPEPADDRPTRVEDEELLRELLEAWGRVGPGATERAARLLGDGVRQVVDGWFELYRTELWRPEEVATLAPEEIAERSRAGSRIAALGPRIIVWAEQRHMERAHAEVNIAWLEDRLAELGVVPARPAVPPAVAFVDVAGFTRATEERGDEHALEVAMSLRDLADAAALRHGGRLVKLLGDGVLLRFGDPPAAVAAVLDLRRDLAAAGLASHAGIHAGPLIEREGDLFGRTVNVAARLADLATAGEVLVTEAVVEALRPDDPAPAALGEATLPGLAAPLAVFRLAG
jgi:adenylate cyclase